MSRFGNICWLDYTSWDIPLGPWPNNNHNSLKALKTLEILDEFGFH
jgi:hypothetical protein